MERTSTLVQDIAALETVRDRLRRDVAALASEPPHPDIVEEQARALLGFVRPGDVIVRGWH